MVRHPHVAALWLICATLSGVLPVPSARPAVAQDLDGLELMRDSGKGNCSICHLIPGIGLPEAAQGDIGPSLEGVGALLSLDELRARITDPRQENPDSLMPAYGTTAGPVDVASRYRGRPILTPPEIEAVVAWLAAQQ